MTVHKNCVVTLDYTLFNTQHELLDSGATPLVYLHGGYDEVFVKIEQALEGKRIGESVHMQLLPEEAFGEYKGELVLVEDRSQFEDDLQIGEQVEMVFSEDDDEEIMMVYTVSEIRDDQVVLDANHPLSGVTVVFDATVIGIREALPEEIDKRFHSIDVERSVL
ncbi:MAG: peptidylprolyl isomerase [Sulfurospirillum cavolei]|uniref:FKBP-type peptidyl-prolyl cis-trans isomerase n=1 Tax=Sulfurospirillum cavolei TaxID=366522 RepID=UPI0005AA481F|nr:peptidylprolyl isomerase [Sulfurospirillum cavolei]MDY0265610.1 peptidylprolyl isomerase [Sulfurospirillum cavolei]